MCQQNTPFEAALSNGNASGGCFPRKYKERWCAPENGRGGYRHPREQRTENREQNARQARDEVRDGQLWSVYPAGLPQRTRRTTVQTRSAKPSTAKGHKEHVAGGTADFGRTQSGTEDTEDHRDGRRASARRTARMFWLSQRTRRTQSTTQGRAVRARKAHVRPEWPVEAWRASHATLWFWKI